MELCVTFTWIYFSRTTETHFVTLEITLLTFIMVLYTGWQRRSQWELGLVFIGHSFLNDVSSLLHGVQGYYRPSGMSHALLVAYTCRSKDRCERRYSCASGLMFKHWETDAAVYRVLAPSVLGIEKSANMPGFGRNDACTHYEPLSPPRFLIYFSQVIRTSNSPAIHINSLLRCSNY